VVTHGPEWVRCGKDDQLIDLTANLLYCLHWANWNGSNQSAWFEVSDGLDGCEEGGTGGDAVIHEDDKTVSEGRKVPALPIELLPSSDLPLLHLNQLFDILARKPVRRHRIRVQIDCSCFTHCA
jgi:hypothetical protein